MLSGDGLAYVFPTFVLLLRENHGKTSTRKTDPTGDRTKPARWKAKTLTSTTAVIKFPWHYSRLFPKYTGWLPQVTIYCTWPAVGGYHPSLNIRSLTTGSRPASSGGGALVFCNNDNTDWCDGCSMRAICGGWLGGLWNCRDTVYHHLTP